MQQYSDLHTIELIRNSAVPLTDHTLPLSVVKELVGNADTVLIGESTHGTHDFYRTRCEITKRLITDLGFNAVAIEGDWPDAYRVNRYVRGEGGDPGGVDSLRGFERFPAWMWRNVDVVDFVGWLRDYNDQIETRHLRVGFYGLDLYSLYPSAMEVIRYLETVDPDLAHQARSRYTCLSLFGEAALQSAVSTPWKLRQSCEDEALALLTDLQRQRQSLLERDGYVAEEKQFAAERNAESVHSAVRYYRTMLSAGASSWNLRDRHMMDTLKALRSHVGRRGETPRVVVWAHNSHLGDARHTDMSRHGEWNLGQLARQEIGPSVRSIGMTTYEGSVTAANDWDTPPLQMHLRPGLQGSYEELFHRVELPAFVIDMREDRAGALAEALAMDRLERAVGVIYRPHTERRSHYFPARISRQFDALIHIDHTRTLEPIERIAEGVLEEPPETFPTAV